MGAADRRTPASRSPGRTRSAFRTPVEHRGEDLRTVAEFAVREGERVPFVLTWYPSHERPPRAIDAEQALRRHGDVLATTGPTRCTLHGRVAGRGPAARSSRSRRSPTRRPAASSPRRRRRCRSRSAACATGTTATAGCATRPSRCSRCSTRGYREEARAWRDWLLRAVAGDPAALQIMYGVAGERRLTELELDWLPGYEGSRPVRIGNAAAGQFQLDVYGEVLDALHQARGDGLETDQGGVGAAAPAARLPRGRAGGSPTRASGRCAARGGTSRTRR